MQIEQTTPADTQEVTRLLGNWRDGDTDALDRLIPLVYGQLRRLAQHHMAQERGGHTLQATAVVHEAYLKLVGKDHPDWKSRAHFYAVASLVMRRILLDHARGRLAGKRQEGPEWRPPNVGLSQESPESLIALDQALDRLAERDARSARIVELRYFGGLSTEEVAEVMRIGPATVTRDWRRARAWLLRELS